MDFVQEVKTAADIVSVVEAHVRLRKQGGERFVGLCPFHHEKTPSFSVHAGLQIFKCFGCGKGGDVFNFLMEIQGLSFREALKALAEQQGKSLPSASGPEGDAATRKREALRKIHDIAQRFFVGELASQRGDAARRYLSGRGLETGQIEEFGLGYAPPGKALIEHLRNGELRRSDVLDSGLVGVSTEDKSNYARFRDRLMFPIHDSTGRLIAYGGRVLEADKQPKYLNSPETPIYRKNSVLYNFHRARAEMRKSGEAVLVEGYMDVIGVWRAGIRNAVATCGTALTSDQVAAIRRQCDSVVVNFDADQAGENAAERSVEMLLRAGIAVRVLELPDSKDPDEFCKAQGVEAYREQVNQAPGYFTWLLDRSRKQFDLSTGEGKVATFKKLLQPVLLLPDDVERAGKVLELAEHIGIPRGTALESLRAATNQRAGSVPAPVRKVDGFSPSERVLIVLLANNPEAREALLEDVHDVASKGFPSRGILAAMLAAQRAGDAHDFSAIEGRLEEEDRERLALLLFDKDRPAHTIEEGRQALSALRRKIAGDRYKELTRLVSEAERAGNRTELAKLIDERVSLESELRLGGE